MQTQQTGALTVSFVSLSEGSNGTGQHALDLGNVSYAARPKNPNVQVRNFSDRFVVSTIFGLSVQAPGGHFGSATLSATLAFPDRCHVLRLDGVKLTTGPQVVQAGIPVNKTSSHRLEIEIPTSLTEKDSAVSNSIIFQVVPN